MLGVSKVVPFHYSYLLGWSDFYFFHWTEVGTTLIHLTPYRSSYQPAYLPFPSAQCEYLFWIRSAGNVSISFFLRRGGRGCSVHCTLV